RANGAQASSAVLLLQGADGRQSIPHCELSRLDAGTKCAVDVAVLVGRHALNITLSKEWRQAGLAGPLSAPSTSSVSTWARHACLPARSRAGLAAGTWVAARASPGGHRLARPLDGRR